VVAPEDETALPTATAEAGASGEAHEQTGNAPIEEPGAAEEPPLDGTALEVTAAQDGAVAAEAVTITVEALSADAAITPGEAISYRFRVQNRAPQPTLVSLTATTSGEGWSTALWIDDSPADAEVWLEGEASIEVVVIVTAPADALAGDAVTTALHAVPAP
jgi:hypothetical protein